MSELLKSSGDSSARMVYLEQQLKEKDKLVDWYMSSVKHI